MNEFIAKLKKHFPDGFISGIVLMIILAYVFPGIGGEGSMIKLKVLIKYGIMVLFFFYGLRLSPEKLKSDLTNWRIHLTIQSITFIIFPIIVLLFRPFFAGTENEILWLAVFFMAVLPSTVSSSVVMVSIAKGNISGAIFNASISGIIGIVVTPALIGFFLEKQAGDFNFSEVLGGLFINILLPLIIGLIMHKYWGKWALSNNKRLSMFDKSVILCIVYNSFSDAYINKIFSGISFTELLILSISVVAIFFLVFNLTKSINKFLKFNRNDSITVLFCGSKKSLVHGSVFASVIFASSASGGIFLVPIMIYHAFQLFYISVVAKNYSKEI